MFGIFTFHFFRYLNTMYSYNLYPQKGEWEKMCINKKQHMNVLTKLKISFYLETYMRVRPTKDCGVPKMYLSVHFYSFEFEKEF